MNIKELIKSSNKINSHMHHEFPYRYFDSNKGHFINKTSVGCGYDIGTLSGANDELVENLNKFVCDLPEGEHWDYQLQLHSDNRVADIIELNQKASSQNGGINEIFAENQAIYSLYSAKNGFPSRYNKNAKFDLKRYTANFWVSNRKGDTEQLADLQETVSVGLNQLGLMSKPLEPSDLITNVNNTLTFSHSKNRPFTKEWNPYETINTQILSVNNEFIDKPNGIVYKTDKNEKGVAITLGLQRLPETFHLYSFTNALADISKTTKNIRCPFTINVSFKVLNTGQQKLDNDSKITSLDSWASSPMAKIMPNIHRELADRKLLQEGLSSEECKITETIFTVILYTTPNKQKEDTEAAINSFMGETIKLTVNKGVQVASLLASLPFMASDGFFNDLKKLGLVRTVKSSNLVNFFPIVTDAQRYGIGILLPTFRRSSYYFDPFSAGGDNYNMAVSAASGAGKSVFVQSLVKNVYERSGSVWILDKGDSYKKLTKLYNGTYLNYKDIYLNPFTHLSKIAKGDNFIDDEGNEINPLKLVIGDIVSLIATMAAPNTELADYQRVALQSSVQIAWETKAENACIDDVRDALNNIAIERGNDSRISDLAFQLTPYTKGEIYGDIFNKPSKLDPQVKLTTLELDGFKGDILRPVIFALIVNINQAMYLSGDRTTPKMCIIEEAWKLMSGDNKQASQFIEEGYRTARKFTGSFCSVTQGVEDYYKTKDSLAAYNNSDIHILLRQGAGFNRFIQENPNAFTPYEISRLKDFPTAKTAGFSSIMLRINGRSTFHRLFIDPYTRALLSTEGNETEYLETLERSGIAIQEAVIKTAQKYYAEDIRSFELMRKHVESEMEVSQ